MFHRACLSALLVAGVALAVSGCTSNTGVASVTVSPATQSVSVGENAQFTATGTIAHGSHPATTQDVTSTVTWSSSASAVATVNSAGLATAVSVGSATITATMPGGDVSSSATIMVTASSGGTAGGDVVSLTILPATQSVSALGDTTQFIATGTTSSGATENVTNQVSWSSSSVQVATISSSGLATAVGPGTATITALLTNADKTVATGTATFTVTASTGGSTGGDVTSISVLPTTQSVSALGDTTQFIATGTTSSGATENVTSQVSWSSSSVQVATISTSGLATAVGPGTATITALLTNADKTVATGTATFTVTASTGGSTGGDVTSLSVIPGTQSVPSNDTAQFIAIGTTSSGAAENVTNQVAWSSSSTGIASISSSTGLATAVVPGTATITALLTNADKTVATGTASLTVTASTGGVTGGDVTSLSVIPGTQSDALGDQTQFIAIGTTSSGATENVSNQVSWNSSNAQVATIASGLATAVGQGTATITALLTNTDKTVATGTASLTVTAPTGGSSGGDVTSISVIPGNQSVASPNDTSQFLAIGTTSSGSTENVSGQVAWGSSSTGIVNINSSTGFATAESQGTATITALLTNADKTVATGSSSFTVQGPVAEQVTKLTITPAQQSLSASGQTSQFIALGTSGATGLQLNVTSLTGIPGITWTSSVQTVASVNSTGLVAGVSPGQCTVTAVWTNADGSAASASAIVNVTSSPAPEPLLSLTIIPSTITVGNLQDTGNFLAIGTFSTSPTIRDLTNSVTWLSSFPNGFPVNTNSNSTNPGAPGGVVTAYGSGSATIIAEATDPSTGSIQTATATFNCPLVLPNPPSTPGSCYPGSQASALLETITVYNEGLDTTDWLVEASSATGTADVIHCGPGWAAEGKLGGSVCVATYPIGATVTLKATQPTATTLTFGGWSDSCTTSPSSISPNPSTAAGPNYCTIVPNQPPYSDTNPAPTNITVGAIFN